MENQGQPQKGFSVKSIPDRIRPDLMFFQSIILTPHYSASVLHQHINEKISRAENPYIYVLDLIYYAECFRQFSQKFIQAVLSVFLEWLCEHQHSEYLNLDIKKLAVNMFLQMKNLVWIDLACEAFELERDRNVLKDNIDSHLTKDRLRQAAYVIKALRLQPYFTLEQVAIPLFFSDYKDELDVYLENWPELQLELVKRLDDTVANRNAIKDLIMDSKVSISASHMGIKSDPKHMQKMLWKLLVKYNIPIEQCPNLWTIRSRGALSYLLFKRFNEQSMNDDAFKEMVLTTIKGIQPLHKELVIRLGCLNELDLALEMAYVLNVDCKDWPDAVIEHARSRKPLQPATSTSANVSEPYWEVEDNSSTEHYLTLRLNESDIHLIDSLEKFMECINICESYHIVSFDAEWRPSLGFHKSTKMSLLQLATWDCVFLLDMLALTHCLNFSHWDQLTERIFANPNILKIGYGTKFDLQMLKENCLGANPVKFVQFLDFDPFFQELSKCHPEVMQDLLTHQSDNDLGSTEKGLSGLCRIILGKALNKDEQFSDWERRPLRRAQITYAALDAFCLLQMYEELTKVLKNVNLNLDNLIQDFLLPKKAQVTSKNKEVSKQERQKICQAKAEEYKALCRQRPPLPMSQFRVVVDNMLSGLGKSLRMYGADVIILEDGHDHSKAVKIALNENRALLTTGYVFLKYFDYLPPGRCFKADTCIPVAEQVAAVRDYFNLRWSEDDMFTRCTLCNSDQYLNVLSKDMNVLWNLSQTMTKLQEDKNNLKPFIICENGFITETGTLHTGVKVQMDGMSAAKLTEYSTFYVCCQCGKIYWEGSHHRRAKERLHEFLEHDSGIWNAQDESCTTNQSESGASTSRRNTDADAHYWESPCRQNLCSPASDSQNKDTNSKSKIYIAAEDTSSEDENYDDECIVFN